MTELETLLWKDIVKQALNNNDEEKLIAYTYLSEEDKKTIIKIKLDETIGILEKQNTTIKDEVTKLNVFKSQLDTASAKQ